MTSIRHLSIEKRGERAMISEGKRNMLSHYNKGLDLYKKMKSLGIK